MGEVVPLLSAAGPIGAPEPLEPKHVLAGFSSGEPVLDEWLMRRSLANQTRGASRTYVACVENTAVGYYCLSAGAMTRGHAAMPALKRNMSDPVPVLVLGRLAVRSERKGGGIGSGLLKDAIERTLQAAEIAGIAALIVHALHEEAAGWYAKRGFSRSPTKELTLMLPLAEIRANLAR